MKTAALLGMIGAMFMFVHSDVLSAAEQTIKELRDKLASPVYETRVSALTNLLNSAQKKPLAKEEIDLVLPHLKNDEWRIKVRVLLILPYAANPEWVIQPLVAALKDRDEESSGGGNVPSGACRALVRLADSRGLEPCKDWLKFLESHPKVYGDLHTSHVETTKKAIHELNQKLQKKSSKSREPEQLLPKSS